MNEKLYDAVESVCEKVLESLNMDEDHMWDLAKRLSEKVMSEKSKDVLAEILQEAPEGSEKEHHQIFLTGYNCGDTDRLKKEGKL